MDTPGAKRAGVARQELHSMLLENRCPTEEDLQCIADRAGRTLRQVYRWKAELLHAVPEPESDPTPSLFRIIETGDPSLFEFDALMLGLAYAANGNITLLRKHLLAAGVPVPSASTLCRKWRRLHKFQRDAAKYGVKNAAKYLLYNRTDIEERPAINTYWHWDATVLDLKVLGPDGEPCKPHWTSVIDAGDSFCTGWMALPQKANSQDVTAFLASAVEARPSDLDSEILVGGVPSTFVFDNASEYTSDETTDGVAALGGSGRTIAIGTPTANGVIERLIGTMQSPIVTGLAGQVTKAEDRTGRAIKTFDPSQYLTWDAFIKLCQRCVHEYNYIHKHSALGCTPFELRRQVEHLDEIPIAELAELWKPVTTREGHRKVHNGGGIQVKLGGRSHYFNNPILDEPGVLGHEVWPSTLHHDEYRIAVFDEHRRFICIAHRTLSGKQRAQIVTDRIEHMRQAVETHDLAKLFMEANAEGVNAGEASNLATAAIETIRQLIADKGEAAGGGGGEKSGNRIPPVEKFGARQTGNNGRGPARSPRVDEDADRSLAMAAASVGLPAPTSGTGGEPPREGGAST